MDFKAKAAELARAVVDNVECDSYDDCHHNHEVTVPQSLINRFENALREAFDAGQKAKEASK